MSLWPVEVRHRVPLDFPPVWACAWGDDIYGLWADLDIKGVVQRLRWIEPSREHGFWFGASQAERNSINDKNGFEFANKYEAEPRLIKIVYGFWMADTPCSQAFWLAVVGGENPSHFQPKKDLLHYPVEQVPFYDDDKGVGLNSFFVALNQYLPTCLATLPSEAEWEYACRADTLTAYWWGNKFHSKMANVDHTGLIRWEEHKGTSRMYFFPPNPWGLYDMHGNVWEWCADSWRENWQKRELMQNSIEDIFTVRGGSWFSRPARARAAYRDWWLAEGRSRDLGFRFVLRENIST
ncbi:hypothetical protein Rhein_0198 [Rheinheimera sp. A13L]|uniref:formylglycine-generating enzyme family protein n=1 Tax=Rheinheimera sp. A13L TaxID=506534 RepID=UPI0002124CD1|nr:formylglycine-generating enzyme family protein [Rheinheimera sp. A13L]EGM79738.1 hypothetical protein Rhein_0198 [Rheinheimera sp. A13L]